MKTDAFLIELDETSDVSFRTACLHAKKFLPEWKIKTKNQHKWPWKQKITKNLLKYTEKKKNTNKEETTKKWTHKWKIVGLCKFQQIIKDQLILLQLPEPYTVYVLVCRHMAIEKMNKIRKNENHTEKFPKKKENKQSKCWLKLSNKLMHFRGVIFITFIEQKKLYSTYSYM